MQKNNLSLLLVSLLIGSNLVFASLLLTKKKDAPAVALVLNGKESGYSIESAEVSSFWNNYPYLVLTSEGKRIDSSITLTNSPMPALSSIAGNIIYRYFANDSHIETDTILKILKKFDEVILVTDSLSKQSLYAFVKAQGLVNPTYLLSKKINLSCEKIGKSYVFILSKENRPVNIYFPRREVPDVTQKYLEDNIKRAHFF